MLPHIDQKKIDLQISIVGPSLAELMQLGQEAYESQDQRRFPYAWKICHRRKLDIQLVRQNPRYLEILT